jgi:hypothetical protein
MSQGVFAFVISTIITAIYTFAVYNTAFKGWSLFYPVGMSMGMSMTICWLIIVRYCGAKESLFLYSISWDIMITVLSLLIPICWYGIKFHPVSWAGIGLIVAGVGILKANMWLVR